MKRAEESSQVGLVGWFKMQYPKYKHLITLPSFGENIGPRRMKRLKQMGLTPGWPDIFIAVPMKSSNGLFIEMKAPKGRIMPAQQEMHDLLREQGYSVYVCKSFDEGVCAIKDYMSS